MRLDVGLIRKWWSIVASMGTGPKPGGTIMRRAPFQQSIARKIKHANQTRLSFSRLHAKARRASNLQRRINEWLQALEKPAQQLRNSRHQSLTLRRVFMDFEEFAFLSEPEREVFAVVSCQI